jgi:hypothetical protein
MNGIPKVDYVKIQGPYQAAGPGDTPSRRRILACRPASASEESSCAKRILSTVARRAYRRPVTDIDLSPIMEMYQEGRKKGSFDAGIEQALQLVLANPKFIFRTEADPRRHRSERPEANQRSRARLTPVVLPLELDSGRRAD